MDDKLRRLEHRDSFPLNHIVKTVQNEDLENFNLYKPFITIFELSQEENLRSVLFSQCGSEESYPDVLIF
jgi:hypothetical protein